MNENQLINKTLEVLNEESVDMAYEFIIKNKSTLSEYGSQVYNYLYCLAALSDKKEEALKWLEEAILIKGYWYRPEVFKDSDLQSIWDEERFHKCSEISETRYNEVKENSHTLCTWKECRKDKLTLALHGNQQNAGICRENWEVLNTYGYQVEYVQSAVPDSSQLYRWEEEDEVQLSGVIKSIQWEDYKEHLLCGFSAGCNEILKTVAAGEFLCERIILQSPWIPFIKDNLSSVLLGLKNIHAQVLVICGTLDEDCLPLAKEFVKEAKAYGIPVKEIWVEGLGHDFPEDLEEIIKRFNQ